VDETLFFADRLHRTAARVEALIVNRMFPYFGPVPGALRDLGSPGPSQAAPGEAAPGEAAPSDAPPGSRESPPPAAPGEAPPGVAGLAALVANLADLDRVASREQEQVKVLAEQLPGAAVIQVPLLADDVHDVEGLTEVCRWLFGGEA